MELYSKMVKESYDLERIKLALENELRASAAGYPCCQDDITTYIQFDILNRDSSFQYDLSKILGYKENL
jgi:hypothetical protein